MSVDLQRHEELVRIVARVLGKADPYDQAAMAIDLAWALRDFSLYSVETAKAIVEAGAQRMGFRIDDIGLLAERLYRMSREDLARLSDFVAFARKLGML